MDEGRGVNKPSFGDGFHFCHWDDGKKHVKGSYSFYLFKFHDFFHDLFQFSMTLGIAVTFKNVENYPCFRAVFDLIHNLQQITLWCPPKCVPFELLNCLSLSNFVLVFTSAVTNLTNTTSIFYDFPWPTIINFHDFQGQEMKSLNFKTLQVFHDLYEPWGIFVTCLNSFCPGSQLEEMKHLIKLFIHSFLCFAWIFFLT